MSDPRAREIVAYYRVSSQMQGINGLGMAAQRDAVHAYAEQNGYPIVASYEEVETGRKDDLKNRPALVLAVAHARRSGALLLIARIDRLARSVFVTAQLLVSGVEFVACDNPHANRMTIQILAVMAEHEGRLISERTRVSIAAAKARGIRFGNPSHLNAAAMRKGQLAAAISNRRRARDAYEDLVPLFRRWCDESNTMAEMVRKLNALGHRTRRRGPWSIMTVRKLLDREGLSETYSFPGRLQKFSPENTAKGVAAAAAATRSRTLQAYAAVSDEIITRYRSGTSTMVLARELNAQGSRVQSGKPWNGAAVRRLLRRAGVSLRPPQNISAAVQRLGTTEAAKNRLARKVAFRAKIMPYIASLLERGETYEAIAAHLNRRRQRTARGNRWTAALAWCAVNR